MYRPAPRPLTLVFPTRALPFKDDSASGSRSEMVALLLIGAARAPHRRDARRRAACARTCSTQARQRAEDGEQIKDIPPNSNWGGSSPSGSGTPS
jgi:hypothetical protein